MSRMTARNVLPNLSAAGMQYTTKLKPFQAVLYTDGSCLGNPGIGGWAYLLEIQGDDKRRPTLRRAQGGVKATTNNRMELQAIIAGLHATPFDAIVHVVTDSQYAIQVSSPASKVSANKELVTLLHKLCSTRSVTFEWVKAHNGHIQNTAVDKAAQEAARLMQGFTKV
jgi:ribonuclease HI